MTDQSPADAALEALNAAVLNYQAVVNPDNVVDGWVLLTSKYDLGEGAPVIGRVSGPDVTWHALRGMLEIALDREKNDVLVQTIDDRIRRIVNGDDL